MIKGILFWVVIVVVSSGFLCFSKDVIKMEKAPPPPKMFNYIVDEHNSKIFIQWYCHDSARDNHLYTIKVFSRQGSVWPDFTQDYEKAINKGGILEPWFWSKQLLDKGFTKIQEFTLNKLPSLNSKGSFQVEMPKTNIVFAMTISCFCKITKSDSGRSKNEGQIRESLPGFLNIYTRWP